MQIKYFDGLTPERRVENEEEARSILERQFPDAFFGEWAENYEGDRKYLLVWENEEQSRDDSGDAAVAVIEEVS